MIAANFSTAPKTEIHPAFSNNTRKEIRNSLQLRLKALVDRASHATQQIDDESGEADFGRATVETYLASQKPFIESIRRAISNLDEAAFHGAAVRISTLINCGKVKAAFALLNETLESMLDQIMNTLQLKPAAANTTVRLAA